MRILAVSDSHNHTYMLNDILKKESAAADVIVHCGDGAGEMLAMTEYTFGKQTVIVRGNCDSTAYHFPELDTFFAEDNKGMVCHGHLHSVKYTLYNLSLAAREQGAAFCLFGHTHEATYEFENGIWLINPGSAATGRYAIVDVTGNKIVPKLMTL